MPNQVTALQGKPAGEVPFRSWEEGQNTASVTFEDRSPGLIGATRGRTHQEPDRPIHKILVPTDFSPSSLKAVERAAALARQFDATLTILHVIDINPSAARTHAGTAADLMRQLWVTGASELSVLKESLERNQARAQPLLVEGLPAEIIVEQSSGFDLLVIGKPRARSAWNFFSKQTARRVIERAQCPALVVHEESDSVGSEVQSKAKVAF